MLQLIDSRVGPTKDDEMMLEFLSASELPFAVVATKSDKLNATERKKSAELISSHPLIKGHTVIFFSSLKGEGKDDVWKTVLSYSKM